MILLRGRRNPRCGKARMLPPRSRICSILHCHNHGKRTFCSKLGHDNAGSIVTMVILADTVGLSRSTTWIYHRSRLVIVYTTHKFWWQIPSFLMRCQKSAKQQSGSKRHGFAVILNANGSDGFRLLCAAKGLVFPWRGGTAMYLHQRLHQQASTYGYGASHILTRKGSKFVIFQCFMERAWRRICAPQVCEACEAAQCTWTKTKPGKAGLP